MQPCFLSFTIHPGNIKKQLALKFQTRWARRFSRQIKKADTLFVE